MTQIFKFFDKFLPLSKMKFHTSYLTIKTKKRKEIINITEQVKQTLRSSGIKEGICLINSMHITSSVFINDEESGLKEDFLEWLERLAPEKLDYKHNLTGEDNADAPISKGQ